MCETRVTFEQLSSSCGFFFFFRPSVCEGSRNLIDNETHITNTHTANVKSFSVSFVSSLRPRPLRGTSTPSGRLCPNWATSTSTTPSARLTEPTGERCAHLPEDAGRDLCGDVTPPAALPQLHGGSESAPEGGRLPDEEGAGLLRHGSGETQEALPGHPGRVSAALLE